jgi:rod shape-determining protein MreC
VVLFLVLVIINLPGQTASPLKIAFGGFFLPLFGLAGSANDLKEQAVGSLVPRKVLLQEVERLRLENDHLRIQAFQTAEIWRQNVELREALEWKQTVQWNLKPGRVILRDPANWWRTLHINLGKGEGMATNMPVLTPQGFVGRIIEVGLGSSQVALIGDPKCEVSVRVQETKDDGVITSSPERILDPTIVVLSFVNRNSTVQPGHHVATSGLGVFPSGIPVGQVIDTQSVGFGMYLKARIKLAADLNHLDYVWVLVQ